MPVQCLKKISDLSHFRVASYANANRMTLDRLASIFSVMLVRPPDGQARLVQLCLTHFIVFFFLSVPPENIKKKVA